MSSSFPELVFTDTDDFDSARLNQAMQVLDSRLRALEPFTPSWQAAVDELRLVGLQRLNEAILPSYQRIQELSSLGFLVAESSTSLTLVENQNVIFIINDGVKRALFTPTPFVVITREAVATDYAVAKTTSYDPTTGELWVTIKSVTGNPGPFTDWWIGALAGNALAAQQYFASIDAARAIVVAARDLVIARAAQCAIDAATATSARNTAVTAAANAQLWDPTNYSTTPQMNAAIAVAVANLINGAPGALDQINELAAALGNDANFAANVTNGLANRIRVDSVQSFTTPQKTQAISNIDDGRIAGAVQKAGQQTITGGFNLAPGNLGNIASFTVAPFLGNYQYGVNAGAFTLTAPTSDCAVDILVTNSAVAGAVTFSGFTVASFVGDTLTTTNQNKFLISIRRIGGISTYTIKALQ